MTQLNKRLFELGQKLTPVPRKAIKIGTWRVCPDKIITWQYDDAKKKIFIKFQGCDMGYNLANEKEYCQAKEELDNYNF